MGLDTGYRGQIQGMSIPSVVPGVTSGIKPAIMTVERLVIALGCILGAAPESACLSSVVVVVVGILIEPVNNVVELARGEYSN